ncbi:hypothetical protein J7T55_007736 [Diaporthe amygdali]|uniref:uncharacterized protein n=1 Tax=Phomopsis amygdali TaxID=1214568 RepID=UPI0022FE07AA|nr:uncharacterized protein J7T55_007736 [Diaporthe amygdali]KAJ0107546.1 hypothetical protein J7T55_007736 [Diaporthe amygdali]
MELYGLKRLTLYLGNLLTEICNINTSDAANKTRFKQETEFPQRFCDAVMNAFDKARPVEPAQKVFADFAFAGRTHLFKNKEFMSLVKDQVVPEFGNLVLTALMTGSVSNAFQSNYTFGKWQDRQVNPSYTPIGSNDSPTNAGWGRGRDGRDGRSGRVGRGGYGWG